ncbi:unnamed protein product [Ambrosiozyma monospora]|uniref:Unnamed protein product n=1 Tax=Ambrosiozyma monospora TaxID=43982 RepID=A0ACB5TAY7_AMBMO|nr:unnamed protein product [Ambrosiozyma monospora]
MNAAESTFQDFTKQTRIGLQYAFEEHKTLNCLMDLQAPLIIIPTDPGSWSSPVAILDAGHISIVSDLVDKEKIQEIKDQDKNNYTEDDWNKLNSYLYDKFDMVLQDAQILIGPDIKTTIEQLHSEGDKPSLILDHLTMKFLIELSILPSFYDLPRMRIGGEVPRFKMMMNDYQYKIFMQLLDTAFPTLYFDDEYEEAEDSQAFKNLIYKPLAQPGDIDSIEDEAQTVPEPSVPQQSLSQAGKQHQLEVNFDVEMIELGLSRCADTHTFISDKLVDLIGEKFRLKFFKTATDMHVDLVLADLTMDDFIEKSHSDEFKKLISSKNLNEKGTKEDDLFKVTYDRNQRMVQFKGEMIECYDQTVDMNIADFKLVITQKSFLTLINYALNTFTDPEAPEIPADKLRHNTESGAGEIAPQHIDVNIHMQSMILVFNDDGIKLATLILKQTDSPRLEN